ncbi:hypothetical protein J7L05_06145 [bacterium]|nr:hypothetical protein [bacterium]
MHRFYLLCLLFGLFLYGCSSNSSSPVEPASSTSNLSDIAFTENQSDSGHVLLGTWVVEFDVENLTATVEPVRDSFADSFHYNVGAMLPIDIQVNSWDAVNEIMDVDVTVNNTSPYRGFDLRLIIYTDDVGHLLLNNDGWIDFFDIDGGQDINPFMAYAKEDQFRTFRPDEQYTENLQIYMPGRNLGVRFTIDASFPFNCREPYEMVNFVQEEEIYSEEGWSSWIQIEVHDWQNSVDSTIIYAEEITGETETPLTFLGSYIWGIDLVNNTAAPAGEYPILVKATSEEPFDLNLYDYVTVEIEEASEIADWTWLVYMHESNLGAYAIQNINDMEKAGVKPFNTNVIVLWDKDGTPDDVILQIEKDPGGFNPNIISPEVDDHGEVIPSGGLKMGDEETLEKFLRWSFENYPAENYALTFWDHGNGPFGIVPDNHLVKYCCNGLSIWEIRDACKTALGEHPEIDKFEFLGFDACLMAWIETAYCLREVTEITIASELVEPATGWNYNTPIELMNETSETVTGEILAEDIVVQYLNSAYNGKTFSAVSTDALLDYVIPALNDFAVELVNAMPDKRSTIGTCRTQCGEWGAYCDEGYVKDLGYLAELIGDASVPQSLVDAALILVDEIENSMVAHGHTGDGTSPCPYAETGLQIWFPSGYNSSSNDDKRADYARLEFTDTLWDEFLYEYDD